MRDRELAPFRLMLEHDKAIAAAVGFEALAAFRPMGAPLTEYPSAWDGQRHDEPEFNQGDCSWFAFDARCIRSGEPYAGIVALHRTGARLVSLDGGPRDAAVDAPPAVRAEWALSGTDGAMRPRFDRRPLFLSVLFDPALGPGPARCFERAVEGEFDAERFAFRGEDGAQVLVAGNARELRAEAPAVARAFFAYEGPGFAVRTCTEEFELELLLRPHKNPVTYGPPDDVSRLTRGFIEIHYVQRTRLDVLGVLRTRRPGHPWGDAVILRGEATQDRHWMTSTIPDVRWLWLMGRLNDGRECMAYAIREGDGGGDAPADAGRILETGAWVVDRDGKATPEASCTLLPEGHRPTRHGRTPTRFRLSLPGEGIRASLQHRQGTFVPTRALGEMTVAGIWESPADAVDRSTTPGSYWVDVMPPYGSG